jgi:CubicO group peptidase (beta-lactamase class C family)
VRRIAPDTHAARVRSTIAILVLVSALVTLVVLVPASSNTEPRAALDQAVQDSGFAGAVLVARGETVLLEKGYGQANVELGVPNTPQTVFRIGSVTKQFTAAAILLLHERGHLRLDDPVCRFFPGCPDAWARITLHQLLTHSAGIPDLYGVPEYRREPARPRTVAQLIALFRDQPLDFGPGERFNYSNSGYVLLGAVIERVAFSPWDAFLEKELFRPAGMSQTEYDRPETLVPSRAAGYRGTRGVPTANAAFRDMSNSFAAGGLYSTVGDLYRWERALNSPAPLAAGSLDTMFRPHVLADRDTAPRVLNASSPRVAIDPRHYGYGWWISVLEMDGRRVRYEYAGGDVNGFTACIARFPDDDLYVAALSNLEAQNTCNTTAVKLAAAALSGRGGGDP